MLIFHCVFSSLLRVVQNVFLLLLLLLLLLQAFFTANRGFALSVLRNCCSVLHRSPRVSGRVACPDGAVSVRVQSRTAFPLPATGRRNSAIFGGNSGCHLHSQTIPDQSCPQRMRTKRCGYIAVTSVQFDGLIRWFASGFIHCMEHIWPFLHLFAFPRPSPTFTVSGLI